MLSQKTVERLAGLFLLVFVVSVVVSGVTFSVSVSADSARGDVTETLRQISQDRELFITGVAFDVLSNLVLILVAAALYLAFRPHERSLALIGTFGFLAAAVIWLTVDGAMVAMDWLAESLRVGNVGAESVETSARAIAPIIDAGFPMGAVGFAIGVFSFGLLVAWTGALPRWMGAFGLAGGVVAPFGWLSLPFPDAGNVVLFVGLSIALFFILIIGAWLVLKGTQPAAS